MIELRRRCACPDPDFVCVPRPGASFTRSEGNPKPPAEVEFVYGLDAGRKIGYDRES